MWLVAAVTGPGPESGLMSLIGQDRSRISRPSCRTSCEQVSFWAQLALREGITSLSLRSQSPNALRVCHTSETSGAAAVCTMCPHFYPHWVIVDFDTFKGQPPNRTI